MEYYCATIKEYCSRKYENMIHKICGNKLNQKMLDNYHFVCGCVKCRNCRIEKCVKCNNQPERSKREDSQCCEMLMKLKHIFKEERLLSEVKFYVDDLIKDCEMRCSEHCSNAVRDK